VLLCCRLWPHIAHPQQKSPRQAAVDRLQHQHRVFDLLTQLVCDRVEMARQAVVAAGGQQPRGQLADATVQQVTAGLGQGVWSYQDVLCYLLDALLHLAQAYSDYFDESLMLQLWQALLIDPPCEEDWLPAVQVRGARLHLRVEHARGLAAARALWRGAAQSPAVRCVS
jgi:hypothetical protein